MNRYFLFLVLMLMTSATTAAEYRMYYFHATWCAPCNVMKERLNDEEFLAIAKEHHVEIVTVDVDKNHEMAQAFKIELIPTCILVKPIDEKKEEAVRRRTGLMGLKELKDFVNPATDVTYHTWRK